MVVLAAYLITIASILKHVNFTLGTIIAGVRAIANQCQPLSAVMGEINGDLNEVRRAVGALVSRAGGRSARRMPEPLPPPPQMVPEVAPAPMVEEPAPARRRGKPAPSRRGRR